MLQPQEEQQHGDADVIRRYRRADDQQADERQPGHQIASRTEGRVAHVAAVQLAYRQQVERSDEKADPTGEADVVQHEDRMLGSGAMQQPLENLEEQRVPEHDARPFQIRRHVFRKRDAQRAERHGQDQPRQRPGCGDVEQHRAVRDERGHADDRAHRAEEHRHRNEIGQGRRDSVASGREKVAELVRCQDAQQGDRIDRRHGPDRRGYRGQEENSMEPDTLEQPVRIAGPIRLGARLGVLAARGRRRARLAPRDLRCSGFPIGLGPRLARAFDGGWRVQRQAEASLQAAAELRVSMPLSQP